MAVTCVYVNMTKRKSHIATVEYFNHLKPSGHNMYRQFNIQQFYVLPTQCIYVFCMDQRKNSDYFPIQHCLVCIRGLTL